MSSPFYSSVRLKCNNKQLQGLVFADGEHWAEQKRFAVKHMKTFGFGKSGHESIVQEEVIVAEILWIILISLQKVEEVVQILSKEEGKDILMENQFAVPTINILWSIVASKRFRHHDPETKGLIKLITRSCPTRCTELVVSLKQFSLNWPLGQLSV